MWAAHPGLFKQMGLAGMFAGEVLRRQHEQALPEGQLVQAPALGRPNWPTPKWTPIICPPARSSGGRVGSARAHGRGQRDIRSSNPGCEMPNNGFDPDAFWHMNGAFDLTPEQQAVLRRSFYTATARPSRRNIPHFKVAGRTDAHGDCDQPAHAAERTGRRIHGMSSGQQQRYAVIPCWRSSAEATRRPRSPTTQTPTAAARRRAHSLRQAPPLAQDARPGPWCRVGRDHEPRRPVVHRPGQPPLASTN
jgi:hypothetical protein